MAEIGEETSGYRNLWPTDTSEWQSVTRETWSGPTGGQSLIDEWIDVRDINTESFSATLKVRNVTQSRVGDGVNFRFRLQTENGRTYNVGGGDNNRAPYGEGPFNVIVTGAPGSYLGSKVEYIQITTQPDFYAGLVTYEFEYAEVMLAQGEPVEWDGGGTTDGLVDLENRYSPRIYSNGLGVYPLSERQVTDFFRDLWTTGFVENFIYQLLNNPMDGVISLRYYYGIKGLIQTVNRDAYVTLGNVAMNGAFSSATPIITNPASSEFVKFDAGEIPVTPKFNNFLDYEPYTKVDIYIPYYGFVQLNATEVLGNRVKLEYHINIITGISTANVYVLGPNSSRYRLVTSVNLQVGMEIPVNVQAKDSLIATTASVMGGSLAGAGAAAFTAATPLMAAGSQSLNKVTGGGNAFLSKPQQNVRSMGLTESSIARESAYTNAQQQSVNAESTFLSGIQNQLNPPQLSTTSSSRSGGMDSETGSMGDLRPAIYITRPVTLAPPNYNSFVGTPDYQSGTIGSFYDSEINYIKAGAINNTTSFTVPKEIMDEIEQTIKGGVYLQ